MYIASNSFYLSFQVSNIIKAGVQARNLLLINIIPLFLGLHLGFLTNILSISLSTFRLMYRSARIMSYSLVLFYLLTILVSNTSFPLRGIINLSTVVVSTFVTIIFSRLLTYYRVDYLLV
jgi:hypothetical protein